VSVMTSRDQDGYPIPERPTGPLAVTDRIDLLSEPFAMLGMPVDTAS